jgi:hypothetical protein
MAALVTACGSTSGTSAAPSSAASSATSAASSPASASASAATATTAAASPAASPAAAGPPPCPTRSLQAKIGVSQGTAGSVYTVIVFTNISNVTCTLYGYPGVSFASGSPVSQIGLAATESNVTPRKLVTLAPHAVGNALLRIVDAGNFPASKCHSVKAKYLQIYPPNQTTPIYLSFSSQTCSKPVQILTISVVQPGAGSAS